jgi:hypothetical protein
MLLLAIQFRAYAAAVYPVIIAPSIRRICRLGPLPGIWPSAELMKLSPNLAIQALLFPLPWIALWVTIATRAAIHLTT